MNGLDNERVTKDVRKMTLIDEDDELGKKPPGFGVRHQQCFLLFLSLSVAYCLRVCMGVALVDMVEDEEDVHNLLVNVGNYTQENGSDYGIKSFHDGNISAGVDAATNIEPESTGILNLLLLTKPYPKFKWSKKIQDIILSSFFWGYMILQIPGGYIMQKFGAKYMLFGSLCINGVISLLFPWAAYYGNWQLAIVCRIVMGLAQACFMPGMHMFFGRWAPLEERGRLTGYAYGGTSIGAVIGLPVTGFIAASPLGWPGIFRFYGVLALVMAAFLWWFCAEIPAEHPKISLAERMYIEKGLGESGGKKKPMSVPWKKIMCHRGMWAIIFGHIGNTWGQLTIYTEIPAYLDKVMGVNIKANGLLSALPFLVMYLSSLLFSYVTDMLIVKKILTLTQTRKAAQLVGIVPAIIGFLALSYSTNIYVFESLLILICCFNVATHFGFYVNHIDISPNFAGPMMSVSNFFSNLLGSISPTVAGLILTDVTDVTLWRRVFLVTAGWYALTTTLYVILGTAEVAEWNDPRTDEQPPVGEEELMLTKKENVEKDATKSTS